MKPNGSLFCLSLSSFWNFGNTSKRISVTYNFLSNYAMNDLTIISFYYFIVRKFHGQKISWFNDFLENCKILFPRNLDCILNYKI